jgi:hypothetical protein
MMEEEWWLGYLKNDETKHAGYFPSSFVKILANESTASEGKSAFVKAVIPSHAFFTFKNTMKALLAKGDYGQQLTVF